jgi:hypothetical protein
MKCDSAVYCKQKTTKIHSKTKHARIIIKICPFTCDDLMRRIRAIKGEKESYFLHDIPIIGLIDWINTETSRKEKIITICTKEPIIRKRFTNLAI